jgi:hypothetical protein
MKIQKTRAGPASTKQTSLKYDVKGRVKICIVFVSFYRNNFRHVILTPTQGAFGITSRAVWLAGKQY